MGYLHIENLYRPIAQTILLFRECYALEKIHGTSAHLTFNFTSNDSWAVKFFSGGESNSKFVSLFNQEQLLAAVKELGIPIDKEITVYGEAYGGSQQGMSHTYGKQLKFIVFDVQVGDVWLSVPDAEDVAKKLGLEFVHYEKVSTDLSVLDAFRDRPSIQAIRNGVSEHLPAGDDRESTVVCSAGGFKQGENCWFMGRVLINARKQEGVVLRPLVEMKLNNGNRVITKHKGDDFKETATARPVVDPAQLQVLSEANAIANEWVTNTRLEHVLQKLPAPHDMSLIPQLIKAMTEDVLREGEGEIVVSDAAKKAIGKKAVELFKGFLNSQISK